MNTIKCGIYLRAAAISMSNLVRGGYYSKATTIRGRRLLEEIRYAQLCITCNRELSNSAAHSHAIIALYWYLINFACTLTVRMRTTAGLGRVFDTFDTCT